MPIRISSQFDSGAIEILDASSPTAVQLALRSDSHADIRQWFHFRVQGAQETPLALRITNAGAATYPEGWRDYRAVASYDRQQWFRVPTSFDGRELVVTHTPSRDSTYYAYFEPYSWDRHLDFLGRVDASPLARVTHLGSSIEGRDIDVVTVGAGTGKTPIWVIARQHPGETMAEWFVEGMVERLLDPADSASRALLASCVVHAVPNMNPDGSVRGNLRTNGAGANLNREWLAPTAERSPEVLSVRAAMQRTGVGAFLDVHGDEGLPYVFVDGNERLANYTPAMSESERTFATALRFASPDFQTVHGYPATKDTKVNLTLASKWVGHTYGGMALTLEMPFKDNANAPDPVTGWDGQRSKRLGAAAVTAFLALFPG